MTIDQGVARLDQYLVNAISTGGREFFFPIPISLITGRPSRRLRYVVLTLMEFSSQSLPMLVLQGSFLNIGTVAADMVSFEDGEQDEVKGSKQTLIKCLLHSIQ